MVETGVAKFGAGQYGVVTKDDMVRLVLWSMSHAQAHGNEDEAPAVRKLIRKLAPMFAPADLITLATVASAGDVTEAWKQLGDELRELANKPPFKQ